MTETLVSSDRKEVRIGFDRPFVIIGERINPTGRKKVLAALQEGNFDIVSQDAMSQVAAGAALLVDVSVELHRGRPVDRLLGRAIHRALAAWSTRPNYSPRQSRAEGQTVVAAGG